MKHRTPIAVGVGSLFHQTIMFVGMQTATKTTQENLMYIDPNNPGIKKFREARARGKALAIKRNEIRKANPSLSDNQVEEIIKAQARAEKQSKTIKVGGQGKNRKHKGKRPRKFKGKQEKKQDGKAVKVEYVPNIRKVS